MLLQRVFSHFCSNNRMFSIKCWIFKYKYSNSYCIWIFKKLPYNIQIFNWSERSVCALPLGIAGEWSVHYFCQTPIPGQTLELTLLSSGNNKKNKKKNTHPRGWMLWLSAQCDWVPCNWVPCDWVPSATECPATECPATECPATECPGDWVPRWLSAQCNLVPRRLSAQWTKINSN